MAELDTIMEDYLQRHLTEGSGQSFREYVAGVSRWGRTEDDTIQMLVGDFQRRALYPAKGYQIPQPIPAEAGRAFETLVNLGYTAQLAK